MALSTAFYQPSSRFASSTPSTITGVAWSAGDIIVVIGVTNNATVTLDAPSNANLTFGAADTEQSSGSSESNIYLWQTTAGSSQTGQTININRSSGSGVFTGAVWVIGGGPAGTANIGSNRTESGFSATVSAGSVVIVSCVDWNAVAAGRTIATGSGTATERQDETDGTNYTIWSGDWGGVSAGTFTFGPTDYTGWKVAQAIIEVTASSGTVPDAPTSVTASPDDRSAYVAWSAPASDGGSAITDYVIEYAPGPGYSSWSTFTDGTSTNLYANVTGLSNGTSYKFRVSATNANGTGSASTASAAATPIAPPGGFPDHGYYTAQSWTGRDLLERGDLPWSARDVPAAGPTYVVLVTLGLGATGTTSRDTATAASAPTGAASTATANSDRGGSATAAAAGTSTAAAGHAPAITATAAAAASPTATAAPSPAVTVPAEIGAIAQATISAASDFAGASIAVAGVTASAVVSRNPAAISAAAVSGTTTATTATTRAATAPATMAATSTTAAAHSPAITSTAVAASTAQSTSGHSATVTAAASVGTGAAATVGAAIAATVTAAVGGTVTAVTAVARAIRTSVAAAVRALVRITIGEADAPGRLDVTIAPAATLAPTLAPAATLTVDLAPAAVLAPVLASAAVLDVDAAPAATLTPTIWPTGAP